jgi:7tm Chemosensory receptor
MALRAPTIQFLGGLNTLTTFRGFFDPIKIFFSPTIPSQQILKNLCQQNKLDTAIRCKIVRPCGICSFYSQPQRNITEVMTQISTIHDELCDACSLVEDYFSAQMLTTVAIAFLIIVFNT